MGPRRTNRPPRRRPVGLKFAAAIGAVVLGVLSVSFTGATGLVALRTDVDRLITDELTTLRSVGDLALTLYETETTALRALATGSTEANRRSAASLDEVLLPRLQSTLAASENLLAADPAATRLLNQVGRDLAEVMRLRQGVEATTGTAAGRSTVALQVTTRFDRMTTAVRQVRLNEYAVAERSGREARATYGTTRLRLMIGTVASLLIALTVVLLLVRDLVPRLRAYARFATDVAADRRVGLLDPRGADELAELGRALDHMVVRTEAGRRQEAEQTEFVDTLQVTATEDEAHELVQRHIERSVPGSAAVVLKRNNSENRLDAATALTAGSALAARLSGTEPRTCLALRFSRTHTEGPDSTPLLCCQLCAGQGTRTTCEPLLVGGQVIGSVLVSHQDRLEPDDEARIKNSVAQAAPVLGNLRNLALAEFRANNDSLTGLPNKRATDDTLKRMVAQANRSITPLAALMLDLDHFKQVNDRFGHAKGDEVLAAVGTAVRSCLRAGDFAGRFGGEELLVLLPDTTAEGALTVAEKLRTTIAAITVAGVQRDITVSIGVADLIQHGGDAPGLLRQSDRALYAAKAAGRNRTVLAGSDDDGRAGREETGRTDAGRTDAGGPAAEPGIPAPGTAEPAAQW